MLSGWNFVFFASQDISSLASFVFFVNLFLGAFSFTTGFAFFTGISAPIQAQSTEDWGVTWETTGQGRNRDGELGNSATNGYGDFDFDFF